MLIYLFSFHSLQKIKLLQAKPYEGCTLLQPMVVAVSHKSNHKKIIVFTNMYKWLERLFMIVDFYYQNWRNLSTGYPPLEKDPTEHIRKHLSVYPRKVVLFTISLTAQKMKFSVKISSVNVIKFAENCGFGNIYWRNPYWKTSFFVPWLKVHQQKHFASRSRKSNKKKKQKKNKLVCNCKVFCVTC